MERVYGTNKTDNNDTLMADRMAELMRMSRVKTAETQQDIMNILGDWGIVPAAGEADRLGIEFAMHNCPGWSSSGGPWITERPEYSMQTLTWTETPVTGGKGSLSR